MKKTFSNKPIAVLGVTGLLGGDVLAELFRRGLPAVGAARRRVAKGMLTLNTASDVSIRRFPWSKFGAVIDCTGVVDYSPKAESAAQNVEANVAGPLRVVSMLKKGQRYVYSSTHVVNLPEKQQNAYTLSKRQAERYLRLAPSDGPDVLILRLPGLFSERRDGGLLHGIKTRFREKGKLDLNVETNLWHAMHSRRAASLVVDATLKAATGKTLTVGHSVECSVPALIAEAEKAFGYRIPVRYLSLRTDHYRPRPEALVRASAADFRTDLREYFSR